MSRPPGWRAKILRSSTGSAVGRQMPRDRSSSVPGSGAAPWLRMMVAVGLPLFTATGLAGAAIKIHLNGYLASSLNLYLLSLTSVRWSLLSALAAFVGAALVATLATKIMGRLGVRPHLKAAAVLVASPHGLCAASGARLGFARGVSAGDRCRQRESQPSQSAGFCPARPRAGGDAPL